MKKIGLIFKETSEKIIKDNLKDSNAVFVVRYSGLSGPDLNSLRISLKNTRANFFVVKNSVARRALKGAGADILIRNIEGPCGFVFAKDEPVAVSKALWNFSKDHENLKLEGGSLKDKVLEKKDIESMSKLPSRQVLLTQLVCALNAPILGLAVTLNQVIAKFVICLDQVKQAKEKQK